MISKENARLLFCLNGVGETKVNAILKEIAKNPQYIRVTYEDLLKGLKEEREQREIEYRLQKEEEKKREEELKKYVQGLRDKYKCELKMMGKQMAFHSQLEVLDMINRTDLDPIMKQVSSFNWGYIQGIKAERARRKKVQ